ncbi:hypothetical protein PMAYCL1PPCAC_01326, partial [Pristionchus mayeri]
ICDYPGNVAGCSGISSDQPTDDTLLTLDEPEIPRTRDSEAAETTVAPTTPVAPASTTKIPTGRAARRFAKVIAGPRKNDYNGNKIIKDNVIEKEEKERVVTEVTAEGPTAVSAALNDDVDATPSCDGRPDGLYARGCSSDMVVCSNGILSTMNCPAGLVFHERNQICDYPGN